MAFPPASTATFGCTWRSSTLNGDAKLLRCGSDGLIEGRLVPKKPPCPKTRSVDSGLTPVFSGLVSGDVSVLAITIFVLGVVGVPFRPKLNRFSLSVGFDNGDLVLLSPCAALQVCDCLCHLQMAKKVRRRRSRSRRRRSKSRSRRRSRSRPKSKPTNMALYNRVKAQAKRKFRAWPSAYASGWVVKEYKRRGGKYSGARRSRSRGLGRWYAEKWINVCKLPKKVACGRPKSNNLAKWKREYPYCRPSKRITSGTPRTASTLSKAQIRRRCSRKRRSPHKRVR